jgi:carbonyl reductase 1
LLHSAWWSRETVAVVTGANRGIGHALAARLAEHGLTVVLTARDGARGDAAAAPLRDRGLAVVFRRLDVSDAASVAEFAAWLRDDVGGLDILVKPCPRYTVSFTGIPVVKSPGDSAQI